MQTVGESDEDGVAAYIQGNYIEAFQLWKPLAEQGHANAQFNLGVMYANGRGVMRSGAAAADWYYKAGISDLRVFRVMRTWMVLRMSLEG